MLLSSPAAAAAAEAAALHSSEAKLAPALPRAQTKSR